METHFHLALFRHCLNPCPIVASAPAGALGTVGTSGSGRRQLPRSNRTKGGRYEHEGKQAKPGNIASQLLDGRHPCSGKRRSGGTRRVQRGRQRGAERQPARVVGCRSRRGDRRVGRRRAVCRHRGEERGRRARPLPGSGARGAVGRHHARIRRHADDPRRRGERHHLPNGAQRRIQGSRRLDARMGRGRMRQHGMADRRAGLRPAARNRSGTRVPRHPRRRQGQDVLRGRHLRHVLAVDPPARHRRRAGHRGHVRNARHRAHLPLRDEGSVRPRCRRQVREGQEGRRACVRRFRCESRNDVELRGVAGLRQLACMRQPLQRGRRREDGATDRR